MGGHRSARSALLGAFVLLPLLALAVAVGAQRVRSSVRLWRRHTASEVVAATYAKWTAAVGFAVHGLLPSFGIAGAGLAAWRLYTHRNAVRVCGAALGELRCRQLLFAAPLFLTGPLLFFVSPLLACFCVPVHSRARCRRGRAA